MKKALIIVDIQNDFLENGTLTVKNGKEIIPIVNNIQDKFDLVIATQDWHPIDHKSFASNQENKAPFEVINLNGLQQVLWPTHCVQGSKGADFVDELNMNKVSAIIRKGTNTEVDSYSGFFDNGKRNTTGLKGLLNDHDITDVYVCGLAADYCVFYTAKDAAELGFRTYIIDDATKAISIENYQNIKENSATYKIQFTSSNNL